MRVMSMDLDWWGVALGGNGCGVVSRARPFTCSMREGRVWGLTCTFHVQMEFEVTHEVNKPALSPVAMVTGAKPQTEYGFLCDDESGGHKRKSSAEEII